MAHLNFQHNGGFDDAKLKKLRSIVKQRANGALNHAEVEDIASSILTSAAITASKPDTSADLATIAFAYARNATFYSRAKVQAVDMRMALFVARDDDDSDTSEPDDGFDPASPMDLEAGVMVRSVLRSLPRDDARLLWLTDAEGLTLAEASEVLGVPVPTLHRRRVKARAAFRAAWAA